jgi:hypothetical protein
MFTPSIRDRIDNRDTDGLNAIRQLLNDEDWVALLNHALEGTGYKAVRETTASEPPR